MAMTCDICGKFFKHSEKWSSAMIFDWDGPNREVFRCEYHTSTHGPIQSNAKANKQNYQTVNHGH